MGGSVVLPDEARFGWIVRTISAEVRTAIELLCVAVRVSH